MNNSLAVGNGKLVYTVGFGPMYLFKLKIKADSTAAVHMFIEQSLHSELSEIHPLLAEKIVAFDGERSGIQPYKVLSVDIA